MRNGILALALLLLTQPAAAGDKIGNGGDAVTCRDQAGAISSIELLDLYEGRLLRRIEPRAYGQEKGWESILESWLQELASTSPRRAGRYRARVHELLGDSLFSSSTFTDIPDSRHLAFPEGCAVEQVAVQQGRRRFPEDKTLLVNQELWAALSPRDKAALLLHEAVIAEAREAWQSDTIAVRYFVSLIASGRYLELRTDEQLLQLYQGRLRFLRAESRSGHELLLFTSPGRPTALEFHTNGALKSAPVTGASLPGAEVVLRLGSEREQAKSLSLGNARFLLPTGETSYASFGRDGRLRRLRSGLLSSSSLFGKGAVVRFSGDAVLGKDGKLACLAPGIERFGSGGNRLENAFYSEERKAWLSLGSGEGMRILGGRAQRVARSQAALALESWCPEAR